mgnify:FL=1
MNGYSADVTYATWMKKVSLPSEMINLAYQMLKYPKASNHTILKHLRLTE